MAKKPKIDLVKIGLDGLDIEAELEANASKPNVNFEGITLKVIKPKDPLEDKVVPIVEKLIKIAPNGFMTKDEIIRLAEIPDDQVNRLITKIQGYLRREDTWALQKAKKKGIIYYYVIKFSE